MSTHNICTTCGTQYPASDNPNPPGHCLICEDERQYIGQGGQAWTTMEELQREHHNVIRRIEPSLSGLGTHPAFAIGQRALLIQTSSGNLLWDCITLLDEPTEAFVRLLGGLAGIAISHPHYYSAMVEWSHAFEAPILLHDEDRRWVMRPDPAIQFWTGDLKALFGGLTLIHAGGHFHGGTVLHWPQGADGRGVLCTGDIIQVVQDRRWVSFMFSYPNLIPLPATEVQSIVAAVEPFAFDRIYGAWWPAVVQCDAKAAVTRSAERYIAALQGRLD